MVLNASLRSLRFLFLSGALAACTGAIAAKGGPPSGSGGSSGSGTGSTAGSGSGGSNSGTGGIGGAAGATVSTVPALPVVLDGQPIYSRFVRLTNEQWENSVKDLLQLSALSGLSSTFEGAPPGGNFSNNERSLFVTSGLWTDYESAAETLSQKVARDSAALSKITGGTTVAATFISSFGRRAYRRDLTSTELTTYTTLFTSAAAIFNSGNAFADGAQLVIETMLKSPYFLYRAELSPAGQALTGYEVASKLSFVLRNTIPDNTLLDTAKAGSLSTPDQIAAQATTLLDGAPAKDAFQRFHTQLLGTDRYQNIEKDASFKFTPAMATDLQTADNMFFNYLFDQNLGFKDLLLSQVAFVNQTTAPLYGMTATGTTFKQVQLGSDRPGYFTRAGFLALNGTLKDPDPIRRGVDIIRRVMGNANFSPPAGVTITPVPQTSGLTNRERVTAHTGAGTCGASCHGNYINPLGFAFEKLDAVGQVRTMDNGKAIDTAGQFPFIDGTKSFADAPALLALIAADSQAYLTYGVHMAEFLLTRDIAEKDRAFMTSLTQMNMNAASIKQLALAIIKSDAFTKRGTP